MDVFCPEKGGGTKHSLLSIFGEVQSWCVHIFLLCSKNFCLSVCLSVSVCVSVCLSVCVCVCVVLLYVVSSSWQVLLSQCELLAFNWCNDRLRQCLSVCLSLCVCLCVCVCGLTLCCKQ